MQLQLQVPQVPKSHSLKRQAFWSGRFFLPDRMWSGVTVNPPCLQSQWPGWTRCTDWMTGSSPQLCGRPLHGWVWTCCWTECPNCVKKNYKIIIKKKKKIFKWPRKKNLTPVSNHIQQLCLQCSHHNFLVISHWSKNWLVKKVPGDVLHYWSVASEDGLGADNLSFLGDSADVPQTDCLEIRAEKQNKHEKNI